jgi:DNA end-binding protein Ku
MAARAIWKGVLRLRDVRVPVKLYSALEERSVSFRLLERERLAPISQVLVRQDDDDGDEVPYDATKKAFVSDEDELVVLERDELARLEPEPSRDVDLLAFVPPQAIDLRLYDRPYYLGPDGDEGRYRALAASLLRSGREGIARWTMRKKRYVGALRLREGYPMLVTLRHPEEVVPLERVERPTGKPLDDRQLDMARQLLAMLEAPFEPGDFRDEYRERVLELVARKRAGKGAPKVKARRPRPAADLTQALEASLRAGGGRA